MIGQEKTRLGLRDVAQRAGVSLQTVSNFLNGRTLKMSRETRERVEKSVQELAYQPNTFARGLRLQRTYTIAYLTIDPSPQFLADPGVSSLLSGIADALREADYCLLVQALPSDDPGGVFRRLFQQGRFDGAVVETRQSGTKRLIPDGCPCVLLEERHSGSQVASVRADNRQGAEQAVNYLLGKGHRRIDFLTLDSPWPNMSERWTGYRAALKAQRLPAPRKLTVPIESVESARAAMEAALRRDPELRAVICVNDLLALGALQAAKAVGRRVPEDLAIIGFGDFSFAQHVEPPLTTVTLPKYEMGRRAAELLLSYLREGSFMEPDIVFPTSLLARVSA